jgi:hypothetical protein
MEATQNSFGPRRKAIKDFLILGVEVLAPRQWYDISRVYFSCAHDRLPLAFPAAEGEDLESPRLH